MYLLKFLRCKVTCFFLTLKTFNKIHQKPIKQHFTSIKQNEMIFKIIHLYIRKTILVLKFSKNVY